GGPGIGGGGLGGPGIGGGGQQADQPSVAGESVYSTGFPGVTAQNMGGRGLGGPGGIFGGYDDEDEDYGMGGGLGGGMGMPGARAQQQELPQPNGLRVIGFAESVSGIQRFVETLRASERTVTGGPTISVKKVHFSEASVLKVPRQVLMQAPVTSMRTALGRGNMGASPIEEQNVYAFEVNVEFDGPYYQSLPENPVVPGMGRGAGGASMGPAFDADDDDDGGRGRGGRGRGR
ncbi:MAG: hypothetical protein KF886_08050, partial [Candidatus Hydrogenedentes bacterium]|nr:hypothetical protein [Candidatus Hydrogenedentota bacterium]